MQQGTRSLQRSTHPAPFSLQLLLLPVEPGVAIFRTQAPGSVGVCTKASQAQQCCCAGTTSPGHLPACHGPIEALQPMQTGFQIAGLLWEGALEVVSAGTGSACELSSNSQFEARSNLFRTSERGPVGREQGPCRNPLRTPSESETPRNLCTCACRDPCQRAFSLSTQVCPWVRSGGVSG